MTVRNLRRPHRNNRVEMTRSNARDDPRADEHFRIDASGLQGSSDQAPEGSQEDDFDATESIAQPASEEASTWDGQ